MESSAAPRETPTDESLAVDGRRLIGRLDELGAIVEGLDRDTRRQGLLDLGDFLLDPVPHHPRVLADQHHDDAHHRLAPAGAGR